MIFIIFLLQVFFFVVSLDILKRKVPEEYQWLGGDKIGCWPPAQVSALGYFLVFHHRRIWRDVGMNRLILIATSILLWICIGIVLNELLVKVI